jgi:hypothetical protein
MYHERKKLNTNVICVKGDVDTTEKVADITVLPTFPYWHLLGFDYVLSNSGGNYFSELGRCSRAELDRLSTSVKKPG